MLIFHGWASNYLIRTAGKVGKQFGCFCIHFNAAATVSLHPVSVDAQTRHPHRTHTPRKWWLFILHWVSNLNGCQTVRAAAQLMIISSVVPGGLSNTIQMALSPEAQVLWCANHSAAQPTTSVFCVLPVRYSCRIKTPAHKTHKIIPAGCQGKCCVKEAQTAIGWMKIEPTSALISFRCTCWAINPFTKILPSSYPFLWITDFYQTSKHFRKDHTSYLLTLGDPQPGGDTVRKLLGSPLKLQQGDINECVAWCYE